ncbi:MAG: glutamate 5-kinase [Pseudomonadota bacterium]
MDAVSAVSRLETARAVVVKVGSALLVEPDSGDLRADWLAGLAKDIADLVASGARVAIVSSGAIALGRRVLGMTGELALEEAQAAASVGQQRLASAWERALSRHNLPTGQVLLTLADTQDRRRYLNGRATLTALMKLGVVPIVNENDTVATDEIRYGDNDRLAARVALMTDADLLVLLSDVDGLYSGNPRQNPDAAHIPEIREITPEIEAMAGSVGTAGAKGGMRTKLLAAQTAMQGGCAMVVTLGTIDNPLKALREGARATWFQPAASPAAARKNWIAGMKPMGSLVVDAGAANALRQGKSLLPAGLVRIEGTFKRGDPASIVTEAGESLGAALVSYPANEARLIAGLRSDQLAEVLGYPGRAAIAHRNDLVIWGS